MQALRLNTRRKIAYLVGFISLVVIVFALLLPQTVKLHANGPSNVGHENLQCQDCHREEIGTVRQRLQANAKFLFGFRENTVSFGLKPVTNDECVYCHERPNDRHPVYRFFEPKYKKVQQNLKPQFCVSCHLEHTGKRVTSEIVFCQNCHEKLQLKKDPITKSHQQLIKNKEWASCLGCHDYHGNHRMIVKTEYQDRISKNDVMLYFNSTDSPYSKKKFHQVDTKKLGG